MKPGTGDPACPHDEREEGVCVACGHCAHDVILNRACLACGATDLDPAALSPKPQTTIPVDRLTRRPKR
jgi:hypothetical protein